MQTGQGAEVEDTSLIHENEQAEHGKKSLMGKVKDKAKKLRSKMKSPGKKSEDKESSHASDEDDEDNASSSPEAETPPFSPQVSSQKQHPFVAGTGSALKSDEVANDHGNRGANFNAGSTLNAPDSSGTSSVFNDKKFDLKEDSVSPTPGTKNTESKYDHGLRAAADRPPSESETTERQHNVPAAAEHPSAGIACGLQFRDPKPAADHASGDIYSKKSDYDLPPVRPEGDSSAITNKVYKPQDSFSPFSTDDKFSDSQTGFEATGDKRFSPVGSDGNTGQKNTQSFNAAKGAVAEKLGYGEDKKDAISSEEKLPASVGAHDTTYGASATAPKPATDRASGALTAAKDTVVGVSTAGVGAVKSALYPSDESAIATKNRGESLTGGKNPEKSQSWTDWAYSAKDAVASNLGMNPSSPSAATTDHSLIPPKVSENQTRPESPTSLVKDDAHHDPTSISRGLSSDPADSTPSITDKFKGTVQSLTDSFSSTLGLNSPSATSANSVKPVDPDQKGATQKIWDSAASAKDAVASRLGYTSPSPNQKHNVGIGGDDPTTKMDTSAPAADQSPGVFQRGIAQAKDGAVSAKDSAVSYFHPGHEDAALSEKITQMFSPSKAKESIFGGTGPHSGVTTADPKNTSSAEGVGVVSRVTDAVSSMFGSKSTTNTDHPQHTVHSKENSGGGQTDGSFSKSPASEQNIIH